MYLNQTEIVSKQQLKRAFRQSIFDAFGGSCAYCGDIATSLDHVLPKFLGGETIAKNLVPSCRRCNQNKGSEQWLQWYRAKSFYDASKEQRIQCHIQLNNDPSKTS